MIKHYKVNEDVEIGGEHFEAGSSFSVDENETLNGLDEAIADSKVVNVAEDAIDAPKSSEEPSAENTSDTLNAPESPKDEASSSESSADEDKNAGEASEDEDTAGESQA